MEFDRKILEDLEAARQKVGRVVRAIDIAVVPTSFVRSVMRIEDRHLQDEQIERFYGRRFPQNSKARWFFPITYFAAGVLETARAVCYLYGIYSLIN